MKEKKKKEKEKQPFMREDKSKRKDSKKITAL